MSEQNFQTQPNTPVAESGQPGAATMSTPETLMSIFFEPGRTFEALRARPRFLVAGLIIVALTTLVTFALFKKVNYENFMREQIENGPRAEQMTPEQKDRAVAFYTSPIGKTLVYVFPLVGTIVFIAAGGAIYLLGSMLMGGALSYKQALSVWTYSSFPPAVLGTLVGAVLLFIKAAEDIDLTKPGGGLVRANLSALLGPNSSPALMAALGSLDVFAIYGLVLAAIGLRKVGKLSSGAAWSIVIGFWLLSVVAKVGWAAAFGKAS